MKGMVLTAPHEVTPRDVKPPDRDSGEALIRVSNSGICGTDLKIFQGGIPVAYPRIMGHESVGEVAEAGTGIKSGAPVIVDPAYSCGTCYICRSGQPNLCPNGGLLGRDVDGGFADLQTVPAQNIYTLPDQIDPAVAPLIQPMTTVTLDLCVVLLVATGFLPSKSAITRSLFFCWAAAAGIVWSTSRTMAVRLVRIVFFMVIGFGTV